MRRVLVTGGSGFIGTNLVEYYRSAGVDVLSIDLREPRHPQHQDVFRQVDILDSKTLSHAVREYAPTQVVHLAARTDLDESAGLDGYRANTDGVRNLVEAIAGQRSVQRALFASTKLVCPTDARVTRDDDYRPDTIYGQSKVIGEQIVRQSTAMACDWCLFRPTSIWGPWCEIPYGRFFRMVGRGLYFHPGGIDAPRSFGYVGNVIFQLEKMFAAPRTEIHQRVFYVSDYDPFLIRQWANAISLRMRGTPVRTIPAWLIRMAAWAGDALKFLGVKDPPISSFRLRNMRADTTGVPLDATRELTGPLPYSMEDGVEQTVRWLRGEPVSATVESARGDRDRGHRPHPHWSDSRRSQQV
jgi:nucleoside-diphosphate-sugar epimerase